MNQEVRAGLSISAGSPLATQKNRLQPTPTMPCPSSPSPVRQTPRNTLIHTYSIISTHMPPTVTPHMTSGPVTVGVPVRSRTFHVTEPAHSLSIGTLWVGITKYDVRRTTIYSALSKLNSPILLFRSTCSFQGPSSDRGAGEGRGHSGTADAPTRPQLPSAPRTVSSSHAQKQAAAAATGSHRGQPGGSKFKQTTHHVLCQRPPRSTQTPSCSPGAGQKEQRPSLTPSRAEYRKFKW